MEPEHPCPCCGCLCHDEPPGTYFVSNICYWEDDRVQLVFPESGLGANPVSFIEAQRNFVAFGACSNLFLENVRRPKATDVQDPGWRPLDTQLDRYLKHERPEDPVLWHSVKGSNPCLYYWRSEYWLLTRGA